MTYKLVIATPVDGTPETASVSAGYAAAFAQLMRDPAVCGVPIQIMFSQDIVRARNRAAAFILREIPDATHVLWWDDDVVPNDLQIIPRMLATGLDVVGAPYPRKRLPIAWTFRSDGTAIVESQLARVLGLGFGFTITTVRALNQMTFHYREETGYIDIMTDGTEHPVGGLFNQVLSPDVISPRWKGWRTLLSEDYSFCHRWREMGNEVWLYLGPGSPLAHVGLHKFLGEASDLLLSPVWASNRSPSLT